MEHVSIFGLGYVGSVAAGCLAAEGLRVTGVDVHPEKLARINAGAAPIHEPGLDELLAAAVADGRLTATNDVEAAVRNSDASIICVGTPSDDSGALDLRFAERVAEQIAEAIGDKPHHHVVFRSTMLPGSTKAIAAKYLQPLVDSGQVEIWFYPEFLRQGAAVADYRNPSLAVIGQLNEGQNAEEIAPLLSEGIEVTTLECAELVKYACNAFHATKVVFANEIGRIGKNLGIDSRTVMDLVCRDEKLNISAHYMKPGNAFGGSCLPKDVSALTVLAKSLGASVPALGNLIPSNEQHLGHLRSLIDNTGDEQVVFVGLTFKHDTDDLRGSPLLQLAHDLLASGRTLRIFDPLLSPDRLIGASKELVDEKLPTLPELMKPTLEEALGAGGTVVASNRCVEIEDLRRHATADHRIIDATGWPGLSDLPNAQGICW